MDDNSTVRGIMKGSVMKERTKNNLIINIIET